MPTNKRIKKFICILWPLILNSLLGRKYTDINILLDKAKSIKEIKKNIIGNFSKQEKPFTLKFNSQGLNKKFDTGLRSATPAKKSATTRKSAKNSAEIGTSGSEDCIYPNSRFRPTSKKLERWVGLWHKL